MKSAETPVAKRASYASMVKQFLSGHSWMGLAVGALMYVVCLTGSLVVFFEELERWEQPTVIEYMDYSPQLIEKAVAQFLARVPESPASLYVVLPTDAVPRIHISDGEHEWFVNSDGSLGEIPLEAWTHMLKQLHIYLHLPETLGIIVVGILGVLLCGLIVSGLLAHPKIFKDAFRLRLGGSEHLAQADLHNRLSVWGTPFYAMFAFTGAFIGLVGVVIAVTAWLSFENDRTTVIDQIYGADPVITNAAPKRDYVRTLSELKRVAPTATPIYWVIQNINTETQFIEIAATLPQRLTYSEIYRFQANGEFISLQGLASGELGRQVAYSVYRLHFGHFDSFWVKVIYGVLGLALTVVSATGINIWLAKRKQRSVINDVWVAIVWGLPLALVLSAIFSLLGFVAIQVFYACWVMCVGFSLWCKDDQKVRNLLTLFLLISVMALVMTHVSVFGVVVDNLAALGVNLALIIAVIGFVMRRAWKRDKVLRPVIYIPVDESG